VTATVNKLTSNLKLLVSSVNYGDNLTLRANITDNNFKLVDNGEVFIYCNGKLKTSFNTMNGMVIYDFGKLKSGKYKVNLLYKAKNYKSISKTVNATVKKLSPSIRLSSNIVEYGNRPEISINVSYNNKELSFGNYTIFVDGIKYKQGKYKGYTQQSLGQYASGKYKVNILYRDPNCNSISKTIYVTVNKATAVIKTFKQNIYENENASAIINITSSGNSKISYGAVNIKLDGKLKATITNTNGQINYKLGKLSRGTHNISYTFSSNNFNTITAGSTIVVNKLRDAQLWFDSEYTSIITDKNSEKIGVHLYSDDDMYNGTINYYVDERFSNSVRITNITYLREYDYYSAGASLTLNFTSGTHEVKVVFVKRGFNSLSDKITVYVKNAVYVSASGSDNTGDGSLVRPYNTINKAIKEAPNGGVVNLLSNFTTLGVNQIKITKNITIHQQKDAHISITTDNDKLFVIPKNIKVKLEDVFIIDSVSGTIFDNNGTLIMDNCFFRNDFINSIYVKSVKSIIHNRGTLIIQNSLFGENKGASLGGVIHSFSGKLEIYYSLFYDNFIQSTEEYMGSGGCIMVENTNTIIKDSFFETNSISGMGGAIFKQNGNLIVNNTLFSGNTAGGGGAISTVDTSSTSTLNVENSSFENNNANYRGGSISIDGTRNVIINNNNFINSTVIHDFYDYDIYKMGGRVISADNTYNINIEDNYWGETYPTWGKVIGGISQPNYYYTNPLDLD